MRLSDLLKADAVTESGQRLGSVHDVAFTRAGAGHVGWRATALLVGPVGFAWRLGYARGTTQGPAPLGAAMRWISRHGIEIPWDAVMAVEPGRVVVRGEREDFERVSRSREP